MGLQQCTAGVAESTLGATAAGLGGWFVVLVAVFPICGDF